MKPFWGPLRLFRPLKPWFQAFLNTLNIFGFYLSFLHQHYNRKRAIKWNPYSISTFTKIHQKLRFAFVIFLELVILVLVLLGLLIINLVLVELLKSQLV